MAGKAQLGGVCYCTNIQPLPIITHPQETAMDMPVKSLNTEKAKALQAALAQIEKQHGKGAIMRLGEGEVIDDIEVVSTGSLGLDIALGVGGLPRGRVVEIRSWGAPVPSSTPSTRSTCNTPRSSASTCRSS
jgi:recombination protein RecA